MVVYGLYEGLYVVPIGVEVKVAIRSGRELYQYIAQVRETYEPALIYIYLAAYEVRKEELVKDYLSEVGYGLLKVGEDDVEVAARARPKRAYGSEHCYSEVASRGTLVMATVRALTSRGFRREDLNISLTWVGPRLPITYCSFLRHSYAVLGVYALGLESVGRLLDFLMDREPLLRSLEESGYRIFLESYRAVKKVVDYVRPFDEPLSIDVVKELHSIVRRRKGTKPAPLKDGWGVGLGVYRRLWDVAYVPTYPRALRAVERALEELKDFRELIQPQEETVQSIPG